MVRRRPVLGRLLGLETEYAIRWGLPWPSPGNRKIFERVRDELESRVATRPGRGLRQKLEFFTQNGGAFSYEHLPHCTDGGLIEGATPECRSPTELLLYQKAQDLLLAECVGETAYAQFDSDSLGLLKNCRDAEGRRYGAQENYEAELARGPALWLFRGAMALLLPWVAVWTVIAWIVQVSMVVVLVPLFLLLTLVHALVPSLRTSAFLQSVAEGDTAFENSLGRLTLGISYFLSYPLAFPHLVLLHLFAFRGVRRSATAFLVSRPLLTGAGTVEPDGRFGLSEKGPAVRRVMRWTVAPADRCILDPGNLIKQLLLGIDFRRGSLSSLLRRRQRLQLGLSDSNMSQTAELLKVGTTSLVLDMVEDGFLDDAPRLADPVAALHRIIDDPILTARVELRSGTEDSKTALELQRFYQRRAEAYLKAVETPSMEAFQIVRLWGEVLDRLERGERSSLVGLLDWVTKRAMIEECDAEGSHDVRKTLDLRYHELGNGYWAKLEQAGLAPVLVGEEEARRAIREPPEGTPAHFRGRWIREHRGAPVSAKVSWDSVHLGGRLRPTVVPFRPPNRS